MSRRCRPVVSPASCRVEWLPDLATTLCRSSYQMAAKPRALDSNSHVARGQNCCGPPFRVPSPPSSCIIF
ncbi:unnamed protein product [Urochloa humidicola]